MKTIMRSALSGLNEIIRPAGFQLSRINRNDPFLDVAPTVKAIRSLVDGFALGTPEQTFTLCDAIAYVTRARIPGAFVECGVYRGGTAMAAALMFKHLGEDRDLHLYDTFEGMPPPAERDVEIATGKSMVEAQRFFAATGKSWTKAEQS